MSQSFQYGNYDQAIMQGHGKIDSVFSTDQTALFVNSPEKKLSENIYYLQGEQALKDKYYATAIESFGKAIEINPGNHDIYLDRAYAYLEKGEFDNSLKDYQVYTKQKISGKSRSEERRVGKER